MGKRAAAQIIFNYVKILIISIEPYIYIYIEAGTSILSNNMCLAIMFHAYLLLYVKIMQELQVQTDIAQYNP